MALVISPSCDSVPINGFPNLVCTGRIDDPLRFMKGQTTGMERKFAVREQLVDLLLCVGNQLLVTNTVNTPR